MKQKLNLKKSINQFPSILTSFLLNNADLLQAQRILNELSVHRLFYRHTFLMTSSNVHAHCILDWVWFDHTILIISRTWFLTSCLVQLSSRIHSLLLSLCSCNTDVYSIGQRLSDFSLGISSALICVIFLAVTVDGRGIWPFVVHVLQSPCSSLDVIQPKRSLHLISIVFYD